MTKECDNTSVGVIIENSDGRIALLERAKFPPGLAPPAGHIDEHGSPEQAAISEVREEIGLVIPPERLTLTPIANRLVHNKCRRSGGDHHYWTVFTATQKGLLTPDTQETKGAGWFTQDQLQRLAECALESEQGGADGQKNPVLERVWVDFMTELGYCNI